MARLLARLFGWLARVFSASSSDTPPALLVPAVAPEAEPTPAPALESTREAEAPSSPRPTGRGGLSVSEFVLTSHWE